MVNISGSFELSLNLGKGPRDRGFVHEDTWHRKVKRWP